MAARPLVNPTATAAGTKRPFASGKIVAGKPADKLPEIKYPRS